MIAASLGEASKSLFRNFARPRNFTIQLLLVVVFAAGSAPLGEAGVVPGRWEKVDGLAGGTPVRIFLHSGDRMECIFQSSTNQDIEVLLTGAQLKTFPKTAVRRMETRYKVPDPVSNGVAIGAGAGLLIGGLSVAQGRGAGDFGAASTVVLVGLMGTGVGYLVDKSMESPEVLYSSK